ncbi:MAG: DNA primase [Pseudomonadota bacterium]|nr:DNA primase [Pseudomonadota bacterium]
MIADKLLNQLTKVKRTGRESWIACCPAHSDKNPSMTITEKDDGRVLVHCFAGCSVDSILGAVGMTFDDLFPERVADPYAPTKPERMPFNPRDVLAAVSTESLIVALSGSQLANGEPLSEENNKRLMLAVERLQDAARICHAD